MNRLIRAALVRSREPASERRIHQRALTYWQSVRGDHKVPLVMHFDFLEREGLADHGFLLDICDATAPKFVSAGAILLEEADLTSTPDLLSVVRSRSLL